MNLSLRAPDVAMLQLQSITSHLEQFVNVRMNKDLLHLD